MATKKFTDGPGLAYAFSKIKALISTKANADLSNVESTALKTAVENSGAGLTVDSVEDAAFAKKAVASGIVGPIVNAESADGVAYIATVEGVTELYDGLKIRILPQVVSASTSPTLDVNGLGAIRIGMLSTFNNAAVVPAPNATWLSAMRPLTVTFHQMRSSTTGAVTLQYWIVDWRRPSATSLYGQVPVQNGGWYVNSDTTDEDKAEALEALKALGLVSKAGDTMTGGLAIEQDYGGYYLKDSGDYDGFFEKNTAYESVNLGVLKDADNMQFISVKPETEDIANAVQLNRVVGDVSASYNLYGEHNKPTASDVGAAASSHNQAASTITAGTFAGQVVANSSGQTYSTYCLRNTRLASADTNPTVNGQICWTYG